MMFIWTIGDLIGLIVVGAAVLFFGVLFSMIWLQDWLRKRRKKDLHRSV